MIMNNKLINGNIYYICFFFNKEWRYTKMTANQIANRTVEFAIGDILYDEDIFAEGHVFEYKFQQNGKKYLCTYSYDSEKLLNIYELSEDEDDEILVEKDIPYQVIKITNDNTEVYKLSDFV